ncbi:MAG: P-loop NTPase, partial [candidate division Zixibacteria bacterium]|nr:P-loop NTPase [candidate division Zixibacteria bacterium]
EDMTVIWRGPLLHKAINQFLTDVLWDKNDFLLIDLPPGTGDVTLTIAQSLPMAELLIVTTPQPIASHTAGRVARLAERTHLRVLGVIENMAYYEANGIREYIFGKGGGRELSKVLGVPFMGEIPIKTEIREGADNGLPVVLSDSPAACRSSRDGQDRAGKTQIADYYLQIADTIIADSPAARAGSI